jgi:hypothetical protein
VPPESVADLYDIFITSQEFSYDETGKINLDGAGKVNFIPCSEMTHEIFTAGYYDEILSDFLNPYCPENDTISYVGFAGTSLWVFPKNNG